MMPTLVRAAALFTTAIVCVVAVAEETTEVAVDKLKFAVPKSWTKEEPSNSLRLAQWKVPSAEGDSDAGEFYITPPIGGTTKQNIDRWIGMFDANGRTTKMTKGTSPQGDYVFVELSGTYNKPEGPPILGKKKPVDGYRMYGVILTANGGGNYFLRLTGPDKTVTAQADAIRDSFGAKASAETEYKQE